MTLQASRVSSLPLKMNVIHMMANNVDHRKKKNHFAPDDYVSSESFKFSNGPRYLNFSLIWRCFCRVLATVQSLISRKGGF